MSLKKIAVLIGIVCTSAAFAQNRSPKLPAYRTAEEKQLSLERARQQQPERFNKTGFVLPGKVRYPGEFEESQAVCISWSYDYDNLGNVSGIDTSSEFGLVSAQLAKYLSDELPVWIRVTNATDTVKVLAKMQNLGWPLTHNYKFIITSGDDWWMRDFGPNGVYIGDKDSLAFIDLHYYDGRDLDNIFPKTLAAQMGISNYESTLYAEGGNLMADGFGRVFFSDVINDANSIILGWDSTQTIDSIQNLLGASYPINLKALQCDGGTGHIDLYTKLVDEQTLLVMEYPGVVTATDKKIIEDNYQYLTTLRNTYDRPFRIIRMPMPTGDAGTYNLKSCAQINADARTFVNGITANKTYIYPAYADAISGNQSQTNTVTALFKKYMPGYKVIPIDVRAVSPLGGSIHCITMQIPADNPVLIWHPSIDGYNPIKTSYPIQAKITNRSGIASAVCKWKLRTATNWNTLALTAGTNDLFTGTILPGPFTENDTIDYYIEALTNNGKTASKPITAPEGYYSVYFKPYATGQNEIVLPENHVFAAYPNPAYAEVIVPFQLINKASVSIRITNIAGKEIEYLSLGDYTPGFYKQSFSVSNIPNGLYFYTLYQNGLTAGTQKLIIKH